MNPTDDTAHLVKGSLLGRLGLSVRGCVVVLVTFTVCGMSFSGKVVAEPLYSLAGIVIGYYFGQMKHQSHTA